MTVITLSRELGSRGDDVALALSERLGLRLAGRDLINRAARAAGAPEVALAEIDELGLLGVRPSPAALRQYRQKVEAVILELADEGNVLLVGRGSQVVLGGRPGVLKVRVVAPIAQRVALVQARCGISPDAAMARVQASDRARAGYLRRNYKASSNDPMLYDLVLNMAQLEVGAAVEAICGALKTLPASEATGAGKCPA